MSPTRVPLRAGAVRVASGDRLAVVLIGAAGFALSFDVLRQVAVAVHVRGPLTYVFPVTLDGFIAYGVRALLVLSTAPRTARAYAWALFAGATAASVWANALHAVRLNHLPLRAGGLRLGDSVVAVLSAVSPLALGGAVHLYILIARYAPTAGRSFGGAHTESGRVVPVQHGTGPSAGPVRGPSASAVPVPDSGAVGPLGIEARTDGGPPQADERTAGDAGPARRTGRPPGASMEKLLEVSRPAVRAHGRPSRAVVERAVREAGLPLGSTRFTALMKELRKEFRDGPVRRRPSG
ncbi:MULTISPECIES: DUF2637 domain-containing protein [Kitasatospora]|uniref:DUF2637 domain-containing protein n=1 Tax=Kitasatospora sp. SID7827 TaxID=2690335 RepID=UPI0006840249|nr:DUF2637 domain-containing protein [Kitasatospora setae]